VTFLHSGIGAVEPFHCQLNLFFHMQSDYNSMGSHQRSSMTSTPALSLDINGPVVERLIADEQADFAATHPKSQALYAAGQHHYLYGAPSHWMRRWAGGFPIYLAHAEGSRITDVDGHDYVDLCLGDSGGMCGHGNCVIAEAVAKQMRAGATAMLPTEQSLWLGTELQRRFGLPYWGLTTSASDANRATIRIARMLTGRPKILVFNGCYHGSVEEAHVALRDGSMVLRNNINPNGLDHRTISKVIEFNDTDQLRDALAPGDVAAVLAEPFMTNYGMIPPAAGFHDALRRLTRETGTLLIIDETHTFSSGPGGYVAAHGLEPDLLTLGKAIAGGVPGAVYGTSAEVAERLWQIVPRVNPVIRQSAHLGFGGTLAGGALAVAAMSAVLAQVLTQRAFAHMHRLAGRLADGVREAIAKHRLPWHVTQIGGRVEYMFSAQVPRNATEAALARHGGLETLLHVFFLNRGVLLTPFHNMVLMCPASTEDDVARHTAMFGAFATWIVQNGVVSEG
jgi:glutamate-1-semialdehyde 2,1-aminomutase